MEALGLDSEVLQLRFLLAVGGFFVIFFILAPLTGRFVHRGTRRLLPEQDLVALLAAAFVIFALSFAVALGILLRFVPELAVPLAIALSLIGALLVTLVAAVIVRYTVRRGSERLDPNAHVFGVWDDDARKRPRNLRRR